MKTEPEIRKAIEDAIGEMAYQKSIICILPWDMYGRHVYLNHMKSCIATLKWVLNEIEGD